MEAHIWSRSFGAKAAIPSGHWRLCWLIRAGGCGPWWRTLTATFPSIARRWIVSDSIRHDFRTARDLERLPIIETEDYQRDPDRFLSTAQPQEAYLAIRTSGSSGQPRTLYHDWRGVAQNAAHAERDRALVADLLGHPRGYRETVIKRTPESSTPHLVQQMLRRHVWFPSGVGVERQYLGTLDPVESIVARLNEFRPHVMHVNGSYLALFFGYLHETGYPATFRRW